MDMTMSNDPSENSTPRQRWRISQVCLGLFIVWQVVFIVGNSLLQMIRDAREIENEDAVNLLSLLTLDLPKEKGPGYQALKGFHHWAEVTGQEQGWSLFAPGIEDQARFLHAVLYWTDGREPVTLPSLTEPADLKAFFRWGYSRLRKYESYLGAYFYIREKETAEQANTRWQKFIQRRVWRQSDYLPGYLVCRWRTYKDEHPNCPTPAQIQMHVVTWQIPTPGSEPWFWQKPVTMPFARIRLNADGSIQGGVQAYNPVSKQFDDLQ
jgi:hypothetical protein